MEKKKKTNRAKKPLQKKLINFQISPKHCDYQKFIRPWCPIFGEGLITGHQKGRDPYAHDPEVVIDCDIIISLARNLFLVPSEESEEWPDEANWSLEPFTKEEWDEILTSEIYPDPEDIPNYPKGKLIAARSFFENYDDRIEPFIKAKYRRPVFEIPSDELLETVNLYWRSLYDLDIVEILSLIAIRKAWNIVKRILFDGELPSRELEDAAKYAGDALERAEREYINKTTKLIPQLQKGITELSGRAEKFNHKGKTYIKKVEPKEYKIDMEKVFNEHRGQYDANPSDFGPEAFWNKLRGKLIHKKLKYIQKMTDIDLLSGRQKRLKLKKAKIEYLTKSDTVASILFGRFRNVLNDIKKANPK